MPIVRRGLLHGAIAVFEAYARDNGSEVVAMPSGEFGRDVASEIGRYRKLLPALGIQME